MRNLRQIFKLKGKTAKQYKKNISKQKFTSKVHFIQLVLINKVYANRSIKNGKLYNQYFLKVL